MGDLSGIVRSLEQDVYSTFDKDMLAILRGCHEYVQGNSVKKDEADFLLKRIERFYGPRVFEILSFTSPEYEPLQQLMWLIPSFRKQFNDLQEGQRLELSYLETTAVFMMQCSNAFHLNIRVTERATDGYKETNH